jgi:hypothetical protein
MPCRVAVAALGGLVLAALFGQARAQEFSGPALVKTLRRGGYVTVMRHAHAPMTPPEPSKADAANTGGERQLDEAGRASAIAVGFRQPVTAAHHPFRPSERPERGKTALEI